MDKMKKNMDKQILEDFINNHDINNMTITDIISNAYEYGYLRGYNNMDETHEWFNDLCESERSKPDYWNN